MRIAVVIPCFNVSSLVEGAVLSALRQTHRDLDIVALDDGSTDGTADVLRVLQAGHPDRFRWLPGERRGAGAARNQGMRATTGEYLQFLDADDVLLPGKIAGQAALLHSAGDVAVIAGAYRNVYPDGSRQNVLPVVDDPWSALVRTQAGTTSANLWQRSAVEETGGWREDLASSQDYELLFRMLKAGHGIIGDPVVGTEVLKRSTGSISRTSERENWLRYLDLRCAVRDHLGAMDAAHHAALLDTVDQYLFMAIRVLSKHDRAAAFKAYDTMIPKGFTPEVNTATGSSYVRLFRWFGFRAAERVAGLFSPRTSRL